MAPTLLMCAAHWRKVPRLIQREVYATYRPGQCDDKQPSKAWFSAAEAAIGFVALREGKKLRMIEARELVRRGYKPNIVRAYVKLLGEEQRGHIERTLAKFEIDTAAQ